jgi:hypothetical protein
VEIIDHPQGLYRGYDVLINLHRKEHYEGYEGLVLGRTDFKLNKNDGKKFSHYHVGGNYSWVKDKWNFYIGLGNGFNQSSGDYYWENKYPFHKFTERTLPPDNDKKIHTYFSRYTSVSTSIDYTISKTRSFSLSYSFYPSSSNNYDNYQIERTYDDEQKPVETVEYDNRNHNRNTEHAVGAYYRDYSRKVKWNTFINYRYNPSKSRSDSHRSTGYSLNNHFKDRMQYFRTGCNISDMRWADRQRCSMTN